MSAYRKGRRFEYQIKACLQEAGYIVTRSAGSHSPWDLVALSKHNNTILFIQCKLGQKRFINHIVKPTAYFMQVGSKKDLLTILNRIKDE